MKTKAVLTLPLPARRALKKLGSDLKDARKRRRIRAEVMAQRAFVSRPTLARAEAGDPSVSVGIYVTLLFLLGMVDRVADLADARHDLIGQSVETARLPKRIRESRHG